MRKSLTPLLLLLLAPFASAQGTYTQIDYPGAFTTIPRAINSAGDIVGYYDDALGYHGFILQDGRYQPIDYGVGIQNTSLTGINDLGQIAGSGYDPLTRVGVGFIYDISTRTFTTVSFPRAPYTYPYGINNAGAVVGTIQQNQGALGFELIGKTYKVILGPAGGMDTLVFAISDSGVAVGYGAPLKGVSSFAFSRGQYQLLAFPALDPLVSGINPAGSALVGYYLSSSGGMAGFVYQNRTFETIQYPGDTSTAVFGINDSGTVVGTYGGYLHGFIWTPPAASDGNHLLQNSGSTRPH